MAKVRTINRTEPPIDGQPDYSFWCPACRCAHAVWVHPPNQCAWKFNGSLENPTFDPSLKITQPMHGRPDGVCHVVVTDGVLYFQPDCTHEMAGRTVAMVDFPGDNLQG
jgi:hypothetical protein